MPTGTFTSYSPSKISARVMATFSSLISRAGTSTSTSQALAAVMMAAKSIVL